MPQTLNEWVKRAEFDASVREGVPMGSLADGELRAASTETNRLFDGLWTELARMTRADAYAWTAKVIGVPFEDVHVASFSYDECVKVRLAIEDLMRPPSESLTCLAPRTR